MSNNTLLVKGQELKRKPDTITIVTMAKRAAMPECDLFVDVSTFMEDNFDFNAVGTDPYIKGTISGLHKDFLSHLTRVVGSMGLERGVVVVIACKAGLRRSVATAELVGRELHDEGYNVEIHHRELLKWFKF